MLTGQAENTEGRLLNFAYLLSKSNIKKMFLFFCPESKPKEKNNDETLIKVIKNKK